MAEAENAEVGDFDEVFGDDFGDVAEEEVDVDDEDVEDVDDDDEDADEPADDGDDDAEPSEAGSEDNPLTIKDLPKDKFVKLTVDGEEIVVSHRELGDGYLRHRSFSRKVNEANELTARAQRIAEAAEENVQTIRTNLIAKLRDPVELDAFMENHFPDEWFEACKRKLRRAYQVEQMPVQKRIEYERRRLNQRYEAQLRQERERREQQERAAAQAAVAKRGMEMLKVPFEQARAEVGNPRMTKDESALFQKRAGKQLQYETELKGSDLSRDEIRDVLIDVYRKLGYAPGGAKRAAKGKGKDPVRPAKRKGKAKRKRGGVQVGDDGEWDFSGLRD